MVYAVGEGRSSATGVISGASIGSQTGQTAVFDARLASAAVDQAAQQAKAAQAALDEMKALAAQGNRAAQAELKDGYLQQAVNDSKAKLKAAVDAEITVKAGANASDAAMAKAGGEISARYAGDPAASKVVTSAVAEVRTGRQVQAIVSQAQAQSDQVKALQVLNAGYKNAPQSVKDALLYDQGAQKIVENAAAWANQPLTEKPDGRFTTGQSERALQRLDQATQGLDKNLAGAVVDKAMPGYEQFAKNNQGSLPGSEFNDAGVTTIIDLSGRIAGTTQGDEAIARFAGLNAWNSNTVINTIGSGGDLTYAIEMAKQLKASGQDASYALQDINQGIAMRDANKIANGGDIAPTIEVAKRLEAAGLDSSGVMKVATDGAKAFKDKVAADVKALVSHDAELAWLVKNDGAAMTPQQLEKAIADYRTSKGAAWQAEDSRLRRQIGADGTKLLNQMTALDQASPSSSGAVNQTLSTIANDPSAQLAISTAIQSDPSLAGDAHVSALTSVFNTAKVGNVGKSFVNQLAAAYVRRNVIDKLGGVNFRDPASVQQAKAAIAALGNEKLARLLGVSPQELQKAAGFVEVSADKVASAGSRSEMVAAERELNANLNKTGVFGGDTVAGQLFRGAGVAFAGAGLFNSASKAIGNPGDPVADTRAVVDAAGFAQKSTDLLISLGKVDKNSILGKSIGGTAKIGGKVGAAEFVAGVSVAVDLWSVQRSIAKGDLGSAAFSGLSAAGGVFTLAAMCGEASWTGPVGVALTAIAVGGKMIYDANTDAHKYEKASKSFLLSAGYNDKAAGFAFQVLVANGR
jgi:hypothetical protein